MPKSVAIRLSTVGKSEVKNDFAEIAQAGEGTARRLTETYEQQAAAAERAAERAAQTAAKIAAIAPQTAMQMQIASANGTNLNYQSAGPLGGDFEGSARRSALAMKELLAEQEEMERRANSVRAAIDPLWAAQQRYNQALSEARTLAAGKVLSDDELIQREKQLTLAFEQESAALARGGQSLGARRAAVQQLGFQVNDIAQGIALGTAPQVLFAQQSGQTAQALQLLAGDAKGFGAFMSGPWGIAITAGVVVLAAVAPELLKTRDELKNATDEMAKSAHQADLTKQAQALWGQTTQGLIKTIEDLDAATGKQILTGKQAEDQAYANAQATLETTNRKREEVRQTLEQAKAELDLIEARRKVNANDPRFQALDGKDDIEARKADLVKQLNDIDSKIETQETNVRRLLAPIAERNVDDRLDKAKAATDRYTDALGRLRQQLAQGIITQKQFEDQLATAATRRDRDIKAAQDAAREANRRPNFGRDVANDNRADLLRAAERYQGLSEHRDKSALESLFKEANISIDPEITKWCAAFVNAVLATQGLKGSGSLAAKSFLGFGSATSSPTAGDIVVSSHRGQDHVGFFEGFDSKGNVRLFSGNTSDRVGSSTIAKGDVLGFRRAPTAAQDYEADAKAAKDAADEVKRLLGEVGQIEDSFDPAGAAARKLAADFDKLDKAAASGAISGGRAAIDKLSLQNAGAMKALNSQDWLKMGGTTLDQTIAQWTAESDQHWKAVEDSADKAGKVVIDSLDEMKQAGEGFIDAVLNPQAWKSWGSLGKTVIHEIESELLKLAVINPLKNLLTGGKLPTLLTSIGSLFGGAGAGGAGLTHELGHNAAGTDYWSGGMTVVGEFGPELANLPTGTRITPASQTRQMMAGANDNPSRTVNNFDFRGAMVTEDVLRFAMAQADGAAIRGAAGGSKMAQDALARRGRQSMAGL